MVELLLRSGHRGAGRRLEGREQHRRRYLPVHIHGHLVHGPHEESGDAGQEERRRLLGLERQEDAGDHPRDEPVREADEHEVVHQPGGLDLHLDPQRAPVHLDAVRGGDVPLPLGEVRVRQGAGRGGEHAVGLALEGVHDLADGQCDIDLAQRVHLQQELAVAVLQRDGLRDVLLVGHMRTPSPVLINPTDVGLYARTVRADEGMSYNYCYNTFPHLRRGMCSLFVRVVSNR